MFNHFMTGSIVMAISFSASLFFLQNNIVKESVFDPQSTG